MAGELPSGTVTFLFTDVEGSTRLWDRSPEAMRAALEVHDRVVRDTIERRGGYVFATGGDGVCAAFQRAGDAVVAAVESQDALLAQAWPAGVVLRVRMGLHTGEASERGGDYFGSAVNRAARLMSLGHGGQVLLSAATATVVADVLPAGAGVVDLGMHSLRGLDRPERVFQLTGSGGGERFGPLVTAMVGNLPSALTSFVGQSMEVKRLAGELPARRLVTLTGVGGVGKTRLALEAAWAARDEFDAGAWLVELAPLVEPDAVVHAVAAVLRVEPQPGVELAESIVASLTGRRLLLVIDNCEHVIGPVHGLVSRIVGSCPTVTVLATSREPLGIGGERTVAVRSLDPVLEAVELFCDRAEAIDATFAPTSEDRAVIAEICARLDGIPLAVELAAARTRSMSLGEIHRRLGDRFRLLRGSGRGGVERHQTLRATVAWSYQLLEPVERAIFERCSVFAGTFDEAAVEAVCAEPDIDRDDVVDVLASLVDKNMIVFDRRNVASRYRLLETLRQYGEEQLGDALDGYRHRHLAHYVTVAHELDRRLQGSDLGGGIAGLRTELDNVRAAMGWAILTDPDATMALARSTMTFAQVAMVPEIGTWFDQAVDTLEDPPPYLYGCAAWLALNDAGPERAIELATIGIDKASGPDDPETADCWGAWSAATAIAGGDEIAVAEGTLRAASLYIAASNTVHAVMIRGWLAMLGNADAATAHAMTSQHLAEPLHSELADACVALSTGIAAMKRGDIRFGVGVLRTAFDRVTRADVRGNVKAGFVVMLGLGLTDDPTAMDDADSFLAGSLRGLRTDGYQFGLLWGLSATGNYLAVTGRLEPAAIALGHLEHAGVRPVEHAAHRQRALEAITAASDHAAWHAKGASLTRDQVVDYVIEHLEAGEPVPE